MMSRSPGTYSLKSAGLRPDRKLPVAIASHRTSPTCRASPGPHLRPLPLSLSAQALTDAHQCPGRPLIAALQPAAAHPASLPGSSAAHIHSSRSTWWSQTVTGALHSGVSQWRMDSGAPSTYKEHFRGCRTSLNSGAGPVAAPHSPPLGNLPWRSPPQISTRLLLGSLLRFVSSLQQCPFLRNSWVIHRFIVGRNGVPVGFPWGHFLLHISDCNPSILGLVNVCFSACNVISLLRYRELIPTHTIAWCYKLGSLWCFVSTVQDSYWSD